MTSSPKLPIHRRVPLVSLLVMLIWTQVFFGIAPGGYVNAQVIREDGGCYYDICTEDLPKALDNIKKRSNSPFNAEGVLYCNLDEFARLSGFSNLKYWPVYFFLASDGNVYTRVPPDSPEFTVAGRWNRTTGNGCSSTMTLLDGVKFCVGNPDQTVYFVLDTMRSKELSQIELGNCSNCVSGICPF